MSVIDNPIITLKSGDTVHIATQTEFENCLTQFLGEDMMIRYKEIEYDSEMENIASDLDSYEAELQEYCHLINELASLIKEAKQAKNKMVILNRMEDKLKHWL